MSRRLYVHLLPTLFEPADLRGCVAVVIDLLRASTTIIQALAAGATAVVACQEVDEARRTAAKLGGSGPVLLGGERGGVQIEGFDLGNSPLEYTPDRVAGRTIVFTTTNGTRALRRCAAADTARVGALTNRRAVLDWLAGEERPVHLVCAGTNGRITAEDCLCAGAFARELTDVARSHTLANDDAQNAADLFRANSATTASLLAAMRNSRGGRNLTALGYGADIEAAARRDLFEIVPEYDPRSGRIVAAER
jgi:2-phosphosulfolactate phosphatase